VFPAFDWVAWFERHAWATGISRFVHRCSQALVQGMQSMIADRSNNH